MDIDSSGSTAISINNNEGKKCSCAVFSLAEDYSKPYLIDNKSKENCIFTVDIRLLAIQRLWKNALVGKTNMHGRDVSRIERS